MTIPRLGIPRLPPRESVPVPGRGMPGSFAGVSGEIAEKDYQSTRWEKKVPT